MTLPFPDFYAPAQVAELYLERAALVAEAAAAYQQQHHVPATQDTYELPLWHRCRSDFMAWGVPVCARGCGEGMHALLVALS
jgi:hypothetical protein